MELLGYATTAFDRREKTGREPGGRVRRTALPQAGHNPTGFGGRLDYEHRLTESLSAVAGAGIEHPFDLSAFNPYWHAEAGLRWRF